MAQPLLNTPPSQISQPALLCCGSREAFGTTVEGKYFPCNSCSQQQVLVALMVPHSQGSLKTLAKTVTHVTLFAATGGEHVTSNGMFCAAELPARNKQVKKLDKDKNKRAAGIALTHAAKKILENDKPPSELISLE